MFVISCSRQHLHHVVGALGVCPGGGSAGLPPDCGPSHSGQGGGEAVPGRLPPQARLAGLLVVEEGKAKVASHTLLKTNKPLFCAAGFRHQGPRQRRGGGPLRHRGPQQQWLAADTSLASSYLCCGRT